MKTTIDIAEPLLVEARELARRDGVTLRSLVEDGLRGVLEKRTADRAEYRPKVITYFGSGTCEGVDLEDWRSIRELIHGVRELWTADRDFGRFLGLRTQNPLVGTR